MLIPNHPHDERLSALASGDPEAVADSVLSEHVASCHRCTDTVEELGALRASLAELPDLHPHRPLQLLPPVTEPAPSRVDRVGGWARRFFAPVLTAGAAIAMVGLVGTTAPLIASSAQSGAPDSIEEAQGEEQAEPSAHRGANEILGGAESTGEGPTSADSDGRAGAEEPAQYQPFAQDDDGTDSEQFALTDERSIWPMVLFAGVALMVAAALLRWILAPRAG